MNTEIHYLTGFGNEHATEALVNALPHGQNSPQKVNYGLYTEQISGSAFTSPRALTLRSWLYRIYPSVMHGEFSKAEHPLFNPEFQNQFIATPQQCRWAPLPENANSKNTFIDGLYLLTKNGSPAQHYGSAVYLYACTESMEDIFFSNSDGELLIVPYDGVLRIHTEMGLLCVEPEEILVIPRGIKFRVVVDSNSAHGYICENYGAPFQLPELGPIGANGLANPRDFLYPSATFEDQDGDFTLLCKYQQQLWKASLKHSPMNVVAWHGNYAPYKYSLKKFNTMNTVSFDHADPSIFTVLTSPTASPGVANLDFVIFPERWMVADHSFRPPYFHRNVMNEFMGLIKGVYDAKENDFVAGGSSIHNCMSAHGPDVDAYKKAVECELTPIKYKQTLAFMFESCFPWEISQAAWDADFRQKNYFQCWESFEKGCLPE